MQQNITVHYKKSNTEKISGAQDCTLIFSVSFLGSAVISSGNLNQKNPHFSWSRWSSALLMLVSWQMLHVSCDPAHSRGFETRWLWSFSFQAILYAAYHNGYCLPDLRQIQLTVMTIISKGIYHTVHFHHVYLALYTDNLFIKCSKLLLFTLIIPIILDFFLTAKKCWHVFTVLFHTAKSDSCLAQPTQWQVNSIVFSQLYHLITTWVSLAVFEEPLSLRWHCNQLLSLLQVISVCQQETWPPHSLFLPDQLLNISLQFWPPSTLTSAAFYICPVSNAGTFPFTQCL